MANFFTSLFSKKDKTEEIINEKNLKKNFDIFKYDGIKALKMGKIKYAVLCFERALHIREDSEVLNYLALAYKSEDFKEDAISIYSKLIGMEPDNALNYINRAELFLQLKEYEETIADCKNAIALEPETTKSYLMLAQAYRDLNQTEEAVVHLTNVIEIAPECINAYLMRSEINFERKEHHNRVSADITKILKISPENENAMLLRAKIHKAKDKIKEALIDYDRVIEINPFNEQAYAEKGRALMENGKAQEAVEFLTEALDTNPESYIIWAMRGEVKENMGDIEGAQTDFAKSREIEEFADEYSSTPNNYASLYKNSPI
ncbi:MAG: tetratricopeptide repeat protein [Culturomica sp.]|jgi:tetratricopeptide (TPR) repeat protein|nr:tetratricopeptide repeat protein [Culturomica sp.]